MKNWKKTYPRSEEWHRFGNEGQSQGSRRGFRAERKSSARSLCWGGRAAGRKPSRGRNGCYRRFLPAWRPRMTNIHHSWLDRLSSFCHPVTVGRGADYFCHSAGPVTFARGSSGRPISLIASRDARAEREAKGYRGKWNYI